MLSQQAAYKLEFSWQKSKFDRRYDILSFSFSSRSLDQITTQKLFLLCSNDISNLKKDNKLDLRQHRGQLQVTVI